MLKHKEYQVAACRKYNARLRRMTGAAAISLLLGAGSAHAAIISGSGQPIDDPVLAGGTVLDFEELAIGSFNSVVSGGITFRPSSVSQTLQVVESPGFFGTFGDPGNQFLRSRIGFAFDFADPVSAFAFSFGERDRPFRFRAFDDAGGLLIDSTVLETAPIPDYIGIGVDGAAIASAQIFPRLFSDSLFIDDFTFVGMVAEEPGMPSVAGPASLWLVLGGLLGLIGVARRRA